MKIGVVHGLAKRIGIRAALQMEPLTVSQTSAEEIASCVNVFYLRQDIVYTMPGMKDKIVVWINGVKKKQLLHDRLFAKSSSHL